MHERKHTEFGPCGIGALPLQLAFEAAMGIHGTKATHASRHGSRQHVSEAEVGTADGTGPREHLEQETGEPNGGFQMCCATYDQGKFFLIPPDLTLRTPGCLSLQNKVPNNLFSSAFFWVFSLFVGTHQGGLKSSNIAWNMCETTFVE